MASVLTAEKLPLGGNDFSGVRIQKFYHGITFRHGERSPQLRITHYELRIESQQFTNQNLPSSCASSEIIFMFSKDTELGME